jgi:hypothetical protein
VAGNGCPLTKSGRSANGQVQTVTSSAPAKYFDGSYGWKADIAFARDIGDGLGMITESDAPIDGNAARTSALVATFILFIFLSFMAWTGKLVAVDGFKIRIFRWIVEDVAVHHLGRAGGTGLFGTVNLLILLLFTRSGKTLRSDIEDTREVAVSPVAIKVPNDDRRTGPAVWMSSLKSNHALGDKPGVRTKYYGHDWHPAEFIIPPVSDEVMANIRLVGRGFAVQRDQLPEAAAVWNESRFKRLGDIFYAGGFPVVRGRLAEVLSRFDLGDGGLVPFPVFKADLETPYPGEFFLFNFGAIKNTILPEKCENATKFVVAKDSGLQIWHINRTNPEGDVVLSEGALAGADFWSEAAVHDEFFLSARLAQALVDIGLGQVFRLVRCRIAVE